MEDALAPIRVSWKRRSLVCLNPCCNGRCTRTIKPDSEGNVVASLNPCCNGRCTRTTIKGMITSPLKVLILVVMEDALAPLKHK